MDLCSSAVSSMRIGFFVESFKVRVAIWCLVGPSTPAFQGNIIVHLQYLFASKLAKFFAGIPILKTKKWTSFLPQPRTWRVWAPRSTKIHSTDLHCTQQGMYQKSCWTNLQSSMQDYALIIDGGRRSSQPERNVWQTGSSGRNCHVTLGEGFVHRTQDRK